MVSEGKLAGTLSSCKNMQRTVVRKHKHRARHVSERDPQGKTSNMTNHNELIGKRNILRAQVHFLAIRERVTETELFRSVWKTGE